MNSKRFRMRIPFQWVAGPGWIFFLLVMVAGCLGPSPDFAKEVRESQQFYVVYYGGRISTRINNQVWIRTMPENTVVPEPELKPEVEEGK